MSHLQRDDYASFFPRVTESDKNSVSEKNFENRGTLLREKGDQTFLRGGLTSGLQGGNFTHISKVPYVRFLTLRVPSKISLQLDPPTPTVFWQGNLENRDFCTVWHIWGVTIYELWKIRGIFLQHLVREWTYYGP